MEVNMTKTTYMVKGYNENGHDFLLHFSFTREDAEAWAEAFKNEDGAVSITITTFESKQDW